MSIQNFIKAHIEKIEPLEKSNRLAWWNLAVTGDEKYEKQFQETNISLRKIYASQNDYQFLLLSQHHPDLLINRQVTLLLNRYIEYQIPATQIEEIAKLETDIEGIYTTFRAQINEHFLSNNDIKEILTESLDSKKRQQAWEASKSIGHQVEKKILQLISCRNESAKAAGFSNYYTMRLKLQELDETALFDLLEQLDKATQTQWQQYKANLDGFLSQRHAISSSDLMPWHYQDPFFQEAPKENIDLDCFYKGKDIVEISRILYQTLGLPVEDILERSDLFEREKKNQHAFCTCIDQKQDVRILCNIRDNEYWMGTQLHELGHAVYDKNIDAMLPYLLRSPAHTSTTEAIAMLFGRLSKDANFLQHYCDIDQATALAIKAQSQKQTAANLLVFARWTLVMVHFERAMYQQPDSDLNTLWWDYVEQFQSIKRVPSRHAPDWAAKLHLACAPVYYQNYLLGEMTASQLLHFIKIHLNISQNTFCESSGVGEFLKNRLFNLGAQLPWEATLEQATGELLNPRYFAKDIEV